MDCRVCTRFNVSPAMRVSMEIVLRSWLLMVLVALMLGCEAKHTGVDTYIVLMEGRPVVGYKGEIPGLRGTAKYFTNNWKKHHRRYQTQKNIHLHIRVFITTFLSHLKIKIDNLTDLFLVQAHVKDLLRKYENHLIQKHHSVLSDTFLEQNVTKLYSFTHILNGAAVRLTNQQVRRFP